jgi:hypothetical protein
MHGGASTGPRTPEGLEKCRRASWKTGMYSAEQLAFRRALRRELRFFHKVVECLRDELERAAAGGLLSMDPRDLSREILDQFGLFKLAALARRTQDLSTPVKNLMQRAEGLGLCGTRGADDSVEVRRMTSEELTAGLRELLRAVYKR